jgi:predicted amidophosphoribosyltransferase
VSTVHKTHCPTCGQKLPTTRGLICGLCDKRIGKGERYHHVGSVVQHVDCANPAGSKQEPQPLLIEDAQ